MPTLPRDIIDELVDVVSDRHWGLKCLLTLRLVSKAFAIPIQAHLFRSIEIKNKDHFQRLLDVLRHNSDLRYSIQELTIYHREPISLLRDHSPDSKNHWIHSSDGGELLDMFTNVRVLTLYGLMSHRMELDRLLMHSLRGRLQAVTELHLSQSMHKVELNNLARLMLHFPALETFSNDLRAQVNVNGDRTNLPPPDGWMDYTDSEGCTGNTEITNGGRHGTCHFGRLRHLNIAFNGRHGTQFPLWFSNSERLSRIEDLQLHIHTTSVSMYLTWDLVRNTASTLRALIVTMNFGSIGKPDADSLRMQRDGELLKAPHLRSIEIQHEPAPMSLFLITDILSAIASSESTPLQTIHLKRLAFTPSDPDAFKIHFWHKLDELTERWKDTLESLVIDVYFVAHMHEGGPRLQEPAEENKKTNPPSEEDIRRGMVNANGRGILDLSVNIIRIYDEDFGC
jgi:hypothetical protein